MDDARLDLAVKSLEGAALVQADGELGPWTRNAFDDALREATEGDHQMLIVDLTRVRSMDVGAISSLRKACVMLGSERKLCAIARGEARRVLEMTRFDEALQVHSDLQGALESVVKPGEAG